MQKRSGVNSFQSIVQCNIIRMRDKTKIRIIHQNGETVLPKWRNRLRVRNDRDITHRQLYVRFEMKFNYVVSKMNINSIS